MKNLILIGGPMGVGKSSVCREIAQEIAARIGRETAGRPAAQEGGEG